MQVGAGPAGLAFATAAQQRGHEVTLFEADTQIGGQVGKRAGEWRRGRARVDNLTDNRPDAVLAPSKPHI